MFFTLAVLSVAVLLVAFQKKEIKVTSGIRKCKGDRLMSEPAYDSAL